MVTPNSNRVEQIVRPAKTGGYMPQVWTGSNVLGQALDGRPRFTWLEVERMRYDPQIQFGLRILRAPLFGVTWKVRADSDVMQRWIDREWSKVYRRMVPRLVRAYEYGCAAGEVVYQERRSKSTGRTRIHFADFLDLHPRDARPLVYHRGRLAGSLAGIRVSRVANSESGVGGLFLDRRHGFWFSGEAEYGGWYGRPRLAGAHETWLEKRGRHGAIDARRLFYKKCAFRGPRVRYPVGTTDMGTAETGPMPVSNQDIARELVEKFENGGVLALPSVKLPDGGDAWTWEDPQAFADVAGLLEYPKQLDKEILIGLGILPELVEASQVGSGYSGRAIPAQVFFTSMDEFVQLVFEAIDTQVMRFLVRLNFGKGAGYEIVPDSLAQMIANSGPGAQPGGAQPGGGPMPNGMMPYQGPRGGHGMKDPRTGRVHYGADKPSYVRLSHTDPEPEPPADELPVFDPATFWTESGEPVLAAPQSVRMGWTPYTGPRGGKGWISDFGEVRYQEQPPDDSEETPERGPAALFDRPEYAGVTSGTVDAARDHASRTAGAREMGYDPADIHRTAAQVLEQKLHDFKTYNKTQPPKDALLDHAYGVAHDYAANERVDKVAAAQFAEAYFDGATVAERAQNYLDKVEEAGSSFVQHLDADTREAIADDLSHLPAEQLAAAVAEHMVAHGADDPVGPIALAAAERATKRKPVAPQPISASAHLHDLFFVPGNDNDDVFQAMRAGSGLVPGALSAKFLPASAGMIVRIDSPLNEVAEKINESSFSKPLAESLLDEREQESLFDALQSPFEVPQTEVPASARNYGGVSGAGGSGNFEPEADWNPADVPVYKRVSDDLYMVRWGDAHPEHSGEFHFVPRSEVPPLSRLPAAYWKDFNTSVLDTKGNLFQNDEGIERNQKRQERTTGETAKTEAVAKKTIGDHRSDIRRTQSEIRRARDEWHRALAGVPEDKRPEEPDWEDRPDESALSDEHSTREEHAEALDALSGELTAHRDALRRQIEDAKKFADRYHNRRKSKAKKPAAAPVQVQASRDELQAIRDAIAAGGDPAAALAKLDELLKRAGGG